MLLEAVQTIFGNIVLPIEIARAVRWLGRKMCESVGTDLIDKIQTGDIQNCLCKIAISNTTSEFRCKIEIVSLFSHVEIVAGSFRVQALRLSEDCTLSSGFEVHDEVTCFVKLDHLLGIARHFASCKIK
jgi:hypothetical protein